MIYLTEKIGDKTVYITEEQYKAINEAVDDQFNYQELNNIPSFAGKVKYCTQHMGKQIGGGSSRLVFQIDDEKVLKLAKNQKGLAQNSVESEWYKQNYDFIPKIFNTADDNSWIECEFVLPAKKQDFKQCLGISFEELCKFMETVYSMYGRFGYQRTQEEYDKVYELADEMPVLGEILQYMTDAQVPVGDLTRIVNWGLAQRNGQPMVVLLDHGFSTAIWQEYYCR